MSFLCSIQIPPYSQVAFHVYFPSNYIFTFYQCLPWALFTYPEILLLLDLLSSITLFFLD